MTFGLHKNTSKGVVKLINKKHLTAVSIRPYVNFFSYLYSANCILGFTSSVATEFQGIFIIIFTISPMEHIMIHMNAVYNLVS